MSPALVSLRVDERLSFANARSLEDRVNAAVASQPALRRVVLPCSAINAIDASALDSLEAIEHRLREAGVALHLSEVKGPVIDRLRATDFLRQLSGQVVLTHDQAVTALTSEIAGTVAGKPPHRHGPAPASGRTATASTPRRSHPCTTQSLPDGSPFRRGPSRSSA